MAIITVRGTVIEGHRVASEPSSDYPYSTLEKQKPYFKALGLDLEYFYNGTLNVSIFPNTFEMSNPEFTFERVEWTDLHPPETFSFSKCTVTFVGRRYAGWVYYPHPETKIRNFQQPSMIEILAEYIPGIHYGDKVEIELNRDEVSVLER
jgi:hypothetical protein